MEQQVLGPDQDWGGDGSGPETLFGCRKVFRCHFWKVCGSRVMMGSFMWTWSWFRIRTWVTVLVLDLYFVAEASEDSYMSFLLLIILVCPAVLVLDQNRGQVLVLKVKNLVARTSKDFCSWSVGVFSSNMCVLDPGPGPEQDRGHSPVWP